ncbi:alpha/beta hydrolase [Actinomadura scrupuli]|uniref:alpha/beta hydrolase n=1 Tax=Actinomadura scrupuli TaxID=559629 RepID=UPI003D95BF9A
MKKRSAIAVVLAVVVAVGLLSVAAQAHEAPRAGHPMSADLIARRDGCERTISKVRLTSTDTATYRVAGWLCGPRKPRNGEVQFLVHGFTYNHLYWMGLGYDRLDYVRAATANGHTTFVIDQLGTGASDHPDPALVTFPVQAYVLHQLVGQLRAGRVGRAHARFDRVVGVGHSMGAGAWIVEAGTYHDVSAVVLADLLHATDVNFVTYLRAHYVTANSESRFAHLPDGYLTVRPRSLFYATSRVDPAVMERDERLGADTGTIGSVTTLAMGRDLTYSKAIKVPVLIVTGRQDALGCNEALPGLSCATASAVLNREAPAFTSAGRLNAYVFDSGHDTNLHRSAPQWFAYANRWIDGVRPAHAGHSH